MVNPVIEIDGSFGEGGGQILRYGIALSVLKQKPVTITNIRAKRPNPGLRPQHLTAINCLGAPCNADIQGLEIESPTVTFTPKKIQPGTYKFDIGTAGSITLIFQACILGSINTPAPITITFLVTGIFSVSTGSLRADLAIPAAMNLFTFSVASSLLSVTHDTNSRTLT